MRIKEIKAGFTTQITPGKFGFFIVLDSGGVELEVDKVVQQAVHFPRIVIMGNEVFEQKDDIYKLAKKVTKEKPDVIFEIHTKGLIKPLGLAMLSNVIYYIDVQLKHTGLPYNKRINDSVLAWYNEAQSSFIFRIKNKDDIDEIEMIINDFVLKKSKVVFMPVITNMDYIPLLKFIINYCKVKGYSYSFDFEMILEAINKDEKRE